VGSLKRKMARARKKRADKEMKEKLGLFDKIPDKCLTCHEPFDKKSKEQALTWSVVVRRKEKVVRLYCPKCWQLAKDIIKEVENDFRVQEESKCKGSCSSES